MAAHDQLFRKMAPDIMGRLMKDFSIDVGRSAAIVGNLGHESGGFKFLQEIKPLIPGSRGGYGWAQWTGPRRVQFEAYCKANNLKPESFEANYGFLKWELINSEKTALPAVRKATTLRAQVIAFELAFERASDKHKGYDSRERYARVALAAYGAPVPAETPKPRDAGGVIATTTATTTAAAAYGFDWGLVAFIGILTVVGSLAFVAYLRMRTP